MDLEILKQIANGNLGGAREMMGRSEKLRNKVNKIIAKEFTDFHDDILNNWYKEKIFNGAYEINAKTEIQGFFGCCELNDEDYEILLKVKSETTGTLLGQLYDFYCLSEYARIGSCDDIEEWIGWFCDREREIAWKRNFKREDLKVRREDKYILGTASEIAEYITDESFRFLRYDYPQGNLKPYHFAIAEMEDG